MHRTDPQELEDAQVLCSCQQASAEELKAEAEMRAAELERCKRQEANARTALAEAQGQVQQQRQLLEQARHCHAAELQV